LSWWQGDDANYSCCAEFAEGKEGNSTPIVLPTDLGNMIRLASGDPSSSASTSTAAVTEGELVTFLSTHAGGTIPVGTLAVPSGIYIPMDPITQSPTGGIYVEGDARIRMNVVQGSSDFDGNYWNQIALDHQGCKFQKIYIEPLDPLVAPRDVYIGDDPCNVTYYFDR